MESNQTFQIGQSGVEIMLNYISMHQFLIIFKKSINHEKIIQQYRAFENMMDECANIEATNEEDAANQKSKWILRMEMDATTMLEKNITMDDVNFTLTNCYGDDVSCVYSDYNADKLVFRIRMNNIMKQSGTRNAGKKNLNPLDQSDQIYLLKNFQDQLLNNVVLRGERADRQFQQLFSCPYFPIFMDCR
jgi:hypothetical protein